MFDTTLGNAFQSPPLPNTNLSLLATRVKAFDLLLKVCKVICICLFVLVQFTTRISRSKTGPTRAADVSRSRTMQTMELALNRCELLTEEKFLLLARKRFVDSAGNLLRDLEDRQLFNKELGRTTKTVLDLSCREKIYLTEQG